MQGSPGPDQGYALSLVKHFEDKLQTGSVDHHDAVAGCIEVAMKRASLFGRAPMIHDLQAAFCLYGFLNSAVNPSLVKLREHVFAGVDHGVHYKERRRVVDLVDSVFLKQSIQTIEAEAAKDWQTAFDVELVTEYL